MAAATTVQRNPMDSMKSTWQKADKSTWAFPHRFFNFFDPVEKQIDPPVHSKTDKVPYLPDWRMHVWILSHALVPVALHHAYVSYTGSNPHMLAVFLFYSLALNVNGSREIRLLRQVGNKTGYLDGDKHARDGIPDYTIRKVMVSLLTASHVRPMLTVMLSYSAAQTPATIHWRWLPLEIGLALLAVDFWFYWYHRLMHEVSFLWKFHRTHHLTKHPNPLLSLYADHVQEVFDVVIIPTLGYLTVRALGLPMGFYETWVCHQYLIFTEALGHSGLRVYVTAPSPFSPVFRFLGIEGIIEDHDLHHRYGWKSSHSYAKHCRLWDVAFGTDYKRIECTETNIDWNDTVKFPLF